MTTIPQTQEWSVLSAPLASVERRALSQAWYSALYRTHSASAAKSARAFSSRMPVQPSLTSPAAPAAAKNGAGGTSRAAAAQRRSGRTAGALAIESPERRAAKLPLAEKIERFLLTARERSAATFVLDGCAGRVRLLVHADGATVRLIALCPERLRSAVTASLAQARYALAARGIRIHARMWGEQPC